MWIITFARQIVSEPGGGCLCLPLRPSVYLIEGEAQQLFFFFFFFWFLYRRCSGIMSWSSTHVLFWTIGPPSVVVGGGGVIPTSIFVGAAYRVGTHAGATQTTSTDALTKLATSTPLYVGTLCSSAFLCFK